MSDVERTSEPRAVASLLFGIVGLFAMPIVGSVVAIVLGRRANARLATDPSLDGAGIARAGVILGFVGLALALFVYVPLIVTAVRS